MPTTADLATAHYDHRERLAAATAAAGLSMWRQVDPDDIAGSWADKLSRLLTIVTGAQVSAASRADRFITGALDSQGVDIIPAGSVNPRAFGGVASDGRSLVSLLERPATATKIALYRGETLPRSLAIGQHTLDMILRTQVQDAGRVADGVAVASRPTAGYVRMLKGRSCARCAILAGRFYRYNAGFKRHPRCDCIHVPAKGEKAARSEGLISNPKGFFDSLSKEEQDRLFTKAGAEAIRDGADMNQVVNARRGAAGLRRAGARLTKEEERIILGGRDRGSLQRTNVYGRDVFITDEGTTRRGLAGSRMGAWNADAVGRGSKYKRAQVPRLMPESIYELAENREDAIRLLRRFGYIV